MLLSSALFRQPAPAWFVLRRIKISSIALIHSYGPLRIPLCLGVLHNCFFLIILAGELTFFCSHIVLEFECPYASVNAIESTFLTDIEFEVKAQTFNIRKYKFELFIGHWFNFINLKRIAGYEVIFCINFDKCIDIVDYVIGFERQQDRIMVTSFIFSWISYLVS